MSKIPARCNKRSCQKRRNIDAKYLTAAPEQMPPCHDKTCNGRMRIDKTRLEGRDYKDKPICTDPHCPATERLALANNGRVFPHRVSTWDCSGYEDYKLESAVKDSKYKPFRDNHKTKDVPF